MEINIRSVSEYIDKCLFNIRSEKDNILVFYRGVQRIYPMPHLLTRWCVSVRA
jgi:hypothetical protein